MKELSINEKKCLYFLINNDLLGNASIRKLKGIFGSYEQIYISDPVRIAPHISEAAFEKYKFEHAHRDIHADYEKLIRKGISLIAFEEDRFPEKLRTIPNPPVAILVNGSLPNPGVPSVAIIGARKNSAYGGYMAREFSKQISSKGIQVISGMATGIDGIAGETALRSGGKSFAVLGCGPDVCYPQSNRTLFDNLISQGGIISEYALGTSGVKWHFPLRNRIISGLSDAVLIIEAKEKSGTLITADCALEQGRDVYALPGRICDDLSIGCNWLIRQGAFILTSPEEFIDDFIRDLSGRPGYSGYLKSRSSTTVRQGKKQVTFSCAEEKVIYDVLDFTPQGLDEICEAVNKIMPMPLVLIMQRLTNMCVSGIIENIGGTCYRRR